MSRIVPTTGSRVIPPGSASRPDTPRLTPEERFLTHKASLHQQLIKAMNLSTISAVTEDEFRREVRRFTEELCRLSSDLLSSAERERLVNEVIDEAFGLGPLEPLMRDPAVSD